MGHWTRQCYFKDYFMANQYLETAVGTPHAVADRRYLNLYDVKRGWYDYTNYGMPVVQGDWYIGNLLFTSGQKGYAWLHHTFVNTPLMASPFLGSTGTIPGLFVCTGDAANHVGMGMDAFVCETANEHTYPLAPNRPGIRGQTGRNSNQKHKGTTYDWSMGYVSGHKDEDGEYDWSIPEQLPYAPFGVGIYVDAGPAATVPSDGFQIALIPNGTPFNIKDITGANVAIMGPAIVVFAGSFTSYATRTYITHFVTFANGDAIKFDPSVEYFFRARFQPDNDLLRVISDPIFQENSGISSDRKMQIWCHTDKLRLEQHFVGEANCNQHTQAYNQRRYFHTWAMYQSYDVDGEPTYDYYPTLAQFSEIVVGSEPLDVDELEVHLGHTWDHSWATLKYKLPTSEIDRDLVPASVDDTIVVPQLQAKDEIEVWAKEPYRSFPTVYQFMERFNDGAIGWTFPAPGTGAYRTLFTPYMRWTDEFSESYADKTTDPDVGSSGATWDTVTLPGSLLGTNPGAVGWNYLTWDAKLSGKDWVVRAYVQLPDAGSQTAIHLGLNGTADVNTAIRIALNGVSPGTLTTRVWERAGGVYGAVGPAVNITVADWFLVEVVKKGALCKVFIDGTFACQGTLAVDDLTNDHIGVGIRTANSRIRMQYLRACEILPDSYVTMTNPAGSSQADGVLYYPGMPSAFDSPKLKVHWFEDWRTVDAQTLEWRWYYGGAWGVGNYISALFQYNLANDDIDITLTDTAGPTTSTGKLARGDKVAQYWDHKISLQLAYNYTTGQIEGAWLLDENTALTLAAITGLAIMPVAGPFGILMDSVANGGECPLIEDVLVTSYNTNSDDVIEAPIYHGVVVRSPWSEGDLTIIETIDPNIQAMCREGVDSGGTPVTEVPGFVDTDVLEEILAEDGDPYWWWYHFHNMVGPFPGTFIPHRTRGYSWWDVFRYMADLMGLKFIITPEQQFIWARYNRDFFTLDEIGLGTTPPIGFYQVFTTVAGLNNSMQCPIVAANRAWDRLPGKGFNNKSAYPTDFIQDRTPAVGVMVAHAPVPLAGGWTADGMDQAKPSLMPTAGADGTAPGGMLATKLASDMSDEGHRDEQWEITVVGTGMLFRPMDLLMVQIETFDPNLCNQLPLMNKPHLYVVQSAHHIATKIGIEENRANTVVYKLGRVHEDQELGYLFTGYGRSSTTQENRFRQVDTAKRAESNTVL